MPCYDAGPSDREVAHELQNRVEWLEAALCASLNALGDNPLMKINYKEAGITAHQLISWWDNHQAKDRMRRAQEKHQKEQRAIKEVALASAEQLLTPEELRVLGL